MQWIHHYNEIEIQKITVYKVPGHTAIDLIDRGQAYFISDSILYGDREKVSFHIRPNRLMAGIDMVKTSTHLPFIRQFDGVRVLVWRGLIIAHINKPQFNLPDQLHPDLFIIGDNAISDPGSLKLSAKKATIILDSSNSFYFTERFLKNAEPLDLNVHSVWHQGAFDFKLTNSNS